jgi:peptidylprolyl isomerase
VNRSKLLFVGFVVAACGASPNPGAEPAPRSEVTVPGAAAENAADADEPVPAARSAATDARVDPDGLRIEEITPGSGSEAQAGSRVVLHYDGTLTDGTVFDSSRKRGTPFEVELGKNHLIPGFERGVLGMRPGGKRRVVIPPELGYGSQRTGQIPPGSVLIFEIELLEIR